MTRYLDCLNRNSSASSECRHSNKDYLNCRMQKYAFISHMIKCMLTFSSGLMEKDEWKNLGLADVKGDDEGKGMK
jgi:cytochrome c oxidase assembly protein subunit 19